MRNKIARNHFERVKTAVLKKGTAASLAKWITENTTYAGQPYSFVDHEFQEKVLSDTSVEVNVRKASQIGLSEASARYATAIVNVLSPFTCIYTLPTSHFAGTFTKTRIDPIIEGSPIMKDAIHRTTDNNEIKRFGDSYLYVRGAASNNAPISIPADMLVHDEYDFCDLDVLTQYTSRLTHSKHKMIRRFSTPTLPAFGIDKEFQNSRKFFLFCKCHHCGHWFLPDYYNHVKVEGFTGDLREITKQNLNKYPWQDAQVHCPSCGGVPSLQPEHREWVQENPEQQLLAAGYQVSPFDAPNIISPGYLVRASTNYDRIQDFQNFNLGLPAEDSEATLSRDDFTGVFIQGEASPGAYVMGIDVGSLYHMVVGKVDVYGGIHVVHSEQVPMGKARDRYHEIRRQYCVACSVIDSGPHGETVLALQQLDPNLYASVYVKLKSIQTYHVVSKEEEKEKGQGFLRQVNVNRSKAFDAYMDFLRSGKLSIIDSDQRELIIQHHCSMKRVKQFDSDSGEMSYNWAKTDGQDHYHHAYLYLWVASRIMGVGRPQIIIPTTRVSKFKTSTVI